MDSEKYWKKLLFVVLVAILGISSSNIYAIENENQDIDLTLLEKNSTEINGTIVGNSIIDLNSSEKVRKFHTFFKFFNFDTHDKYFVAKIIESSSNKVTKEFEITVQSTSTGLINFGTQVVFMISNKDLENEDYSPGEYNLLVTTRDGFAYDKMDFLIIDAGGKNL